MLLWRLAADPGTLNQHYQPGDRAYGIPYPVWRVKVIPGRNGSIILPCAIRATRSFYRVEYPPLRRVRLRFRAILRQ
jgi:hypothetical protein